MQAAVFIQDVYNITGIGAVPVGIVKSSAFRIGMKLDINGKIMTVKSIEMHHQQLQEAHEGDNIGFTLNGGDYKLLKSVVGQDVTFSDEETIETRKIERQEPIHPEGFLDSLKKIFKRR